MKPPSWTTKIAGKTFGIDQNYIYFAGLKIPSAILALPLPTMSNVDLRNRSGSRTFAPTCSTRRPCPEHGRLQAGHSRNPASQRARARIRKKPAHGSASRVPGHAVKLVHTDETVVLVTGSSLTAEERDRPVAYRLKSEIDRRGAGHAYRRAVVVADLWSLQNRIFHLNPTIGIGGPGANGVSPRFLRDAADGLFQG